MATADASRASKSSELTVNLNPGKADIIRLNDALA
jgi:hypothetical protein